jgi:two-component system copper resistance phosphate regulon response regulator CusR
MRILLVEDDKWLVNALVYQLKKENYAVDAALDGETGYELALLNDYDMILLDRMLPRMDGIALLKGIREAGRKSPVLFITARDAVDDRVDGLDAGADDYLVKPFDKKEMLARIRALCRRPANLLSEESIAFSGLLLNPRAGTLRYGKNSVELTPRETNLLELLLRHHGQVIPRETILDRVWGPLECVEPGNIDSYIHFLRKKIQGLNAPFAIRTLRGLGYRLEKEPSHV